MLAWVGVVSLCWAPCTSRAGLPAGGWPQTRRDAVQSGRSDEVALPSAKVKWVVQTGSAMYGEAVVLDCTLAVTGQDTVVRAYDARSGAPLWSHATSWVGQPPLARSALAFDDAGALHAGLPGDPFLVAAAVAWRSLEPALLSYVIDYNAYPSGPDLAPALVPLYMPAMPLNPITGAPMQESETPSPGDYRYLQVGASYHLAVWNTDGRLLDLADGCEGASGMAHPDPTWPLSPQTGGTALALDAATGGVIWEDLAAPDSYALTPVEVGNGTVWSGADELMYKEAWWVCCVPDWGDVLPGLQLTVRDSGGNATQLARRWGPVRSAPAMDAGGGLYFARGAATHFGSRAQANVQALVARGIDPYVVDHAAYPPTGDLAPSLVPDYLPCMPENLFTGAVMRWSTAPSPGDYDYSTPDGMSYQLTLWGETGAPLAMVDTDVETLAPTDEPPGVYSVAPDGSVLWQVSVGTTNDSVTPAALAPDGSVVVGTSTGLVLALDSTDGSERWRRDVVEPLALAPALLPDGGAVFVTTAGTVVALRPDGSVRWRHALGTQAWAAPSTTADGLTYVGDSLGVLHALGLADGAPAWELPCGGASHAALTTSPAQSNGWIYVGRADGGLVAVVPMTGSGDPPDTALLRATGVKSTTSAGWTWTAATLPPVPGAHWHLLRWQGSLRTAPTDVLPGHPATVGTYLDDTAVGPLLFYSLHSVDCGENQSPGL